MCLRVTFATQLPSEWSLKMIKALSLRLNQSFGPFTMSPVETSSETGVFRHLSKHVFRAQESRKYRIYEGHLFTKCSKFNADSKNAEKNWEKIFASWHKCTRIFCILLSLLIKEYLSSAVNVLRKGLKNIHVSKSDLCNSIAFTVITQDDKGALIKIDSVFWLVYHVASRDVLSNGSF